ncbi:hypothetical protein VNO80_04156 [Phaseolus coccineus]|uniref:Uncharacterized protein n=1 Tax=Phaseolus coccineus TaxID=3886 RepID=A0AAN9RJG1_PHACN
MPATKLEWSRGVVAVMLRLQQMGYPKTSKLVFSCPIGVVFWFKCLDHSGVLFELRHANRPWLVHAAGCADGSGRFRVCAGSCLRSMPSVNFVD